MTGCSCRRGKSHTCLLLQWAFARWRKGVAAQLAAADAQLADTDLLLRWAFWRWREGVAVQLADAATIQADEAINAIAVAQVAGIVAEEAAEVAIQKARHISNQTQLDTEVEAWEIL